MDKIYIFNNLIKKILLIKNIIFCDFIIYYIILKDNGLQFYSYKICDTLFTSSDKIRKVLALLFFLHCRYT